MSHDPAVLVVGSSQLLAGVSFTPEGLCVLPSDRALSLDELAAMALNVVSEGVIVTDPHQPDNPIVFANSGFTRITGYSAAEVLGRNCRFLQGPDTAEADRRAIRRSIERGQPFGITILNYRKDGSAFWNLLTVTPILGPDLRPRYFVGAQSDVTELVDAQRALASAGQDLEQRIRQRTTRLTGSNLRLRQQVRQRRAAQRLAAAHQQDMQEFLSVIAHDLKRPVLTVMGLLKLLDQDLAENPSLTPDDRENIALAITESVRMRTMIEELGRLAQIQQSPVLLERVNLSGMVRAAVDRLRSRFEAAGVRLEIQAPDDWALFSRVHVEQPLHNLLENALLHGCGGDEPTVRVHARRRTLDGAVLISVSDNGPGIAPADQPRVFRLFNRIESSTGKGGTGVGLPSAVRMIQRINGRLTLDSRPGAGATFTLAFPADQA